MRNLSPWRPVAPEAAYEGADRPSSALELGAAAHDTPQLVPAGNQTGATEHPAPYSNDRDAAK